MTASTETPPTYAKSSDVAARSIPSRPNADPGRVLETGSEEVGAPTPAAYSPVSPETGTETGRHAGYPVRDRRSYGIGTAETFVREHPVASLLGALSAGFVIGALLSRSGRGQAVSRRPPDLGYDDEDAYQRDYYYD